MQTMDSQGELNHAILASLTQAEREDPALTYA